ncbi:MAG TPA: hypothetical protein VIQ30_00140 [Pseudonocardia sp.]
MALTATYDPTLSRVRLHADNLGATATRFYMWRSSNSFQSYVTVRGGSDRAMNSGVADLDDYEFPAGVPVRYQVASYDAANVMQAQFFTGWVTNDVSDGVWLKSVTRPFLNRQVTVQELDELEAPARVVVHPIMGRSGGVAVSDVRGGRRGTLVLTTQGEAESEALRYLFASGDPMFLHSPAAEDELVPSMYIAAGDVGRRLAMRRNGRREWIVPFEEVAAPDPVIYGASITYAGVAALYSSYNALMAANATYADLLDLQSSASEVIIP